jgi:hypothetical protein
LEEGKVHLESMHSVDTHNNVVDTKKSWQRNRGLPKSMKEAVIFYGWGGGAQKVLNPKDFVDALELKCPKGYLHVFFDDPEVR